MAIMAIRVSSLMYQLECGSRPRPTVYHCYPRLLVHPSMPFHVVPSFLCGFLAFNGLSCALSLCNVITTSLYFIFDPMMLGNSDLGSISVNSKDISPLPIQSLANVSVMGAIDGNTSGEHCLVQSVTGAFAYSSIQSAYRSIQLALVGPV